VLRKAMSPYVGNTSAFLMNQSGDAFCYVSPARCAVSALTSAKRITRLI
jgi:hypothetical protein